MCAIRRIFWLMVATACATFGGVGSNITALHPPQQLIASYNDEQSATLRWESIPGARYYRFQISEQRDFSTIRTDALILQSKTWVRATVAGLEAGKSYWWRVQTLNDAAQSAWSVPVRLSTVEWTIEQPRQLIPAEGATLAYTESIRFSWTPCIGATLYRVEIATNGRFENAVEYTTVEPWIDVTQPTPRGDYYWRVTACRGSQRSEWSPVQRFSIVPPVPLHSAVEQRSSIRLLDGETEQQTIIVAPNPTTDVVTIHSALLLSGDAEAALYDVVGRRVLGMPLPESNTALVPVGQLPAGSYTLVIRTGSKRWIGTVDVLR
ncbi:MAG: T9SS type A sorting domain-containing protein [Chlorobi bacterium]|nr:T9SS type A sorting domain-containing protein [Chlorobiota bacterium]